MNKSGIRNVLFIGFTWILIFINIIFDGTPGILIKISQYISYVCLVLSGILIIGIELNTFTQTITEFRQLTIKEEIQNEVYR